MKYWYDIDRLGSTGPSQQEMFTFGADPTLVVARCLPPDSEASCPSRSPLSIYFALVFPDSVKNLSAVSAFEVL